MDTELFAANPELGRTSPDYVIYVPKGTDDRVPDTGNEHFLVFRRKDGTFARSLDPIRPRRTVQPAHRVRGIRRLGPELERSRASSPERSSTRKPAETCAAGDIRWSAGRDASTCCTASISASTTYSRTRPADWPAFTATTTGKAGRPRHTRTFRAPNTTVPIRRCRETASPGRSRCGSRRPLSGRNHALDQPGARDSVGRELDSRAERGRFPAVRESRRRPGNSGPEADAADRRKIAALPDSGRSARKFADSGADAERAAGRPPLRRHADRGRNRRPGASARTAAKAGANRRTLRYGDGLPPVEQPLSRARATRCRKGNTCFSITITTDTTGRGPRHATETRRPICMAYGKFDPEGRQRSVFQLRFRGSTATTSN